MKWVSRDGANIGRTAPQKLHSLRGPPPHWPFVQHKSKENGILFGSAKGSGSTDTPLTLWTIPELSSVGKSKVQAVEFYGDNCKIVEGLGYFNHCARGRLSGSEDGFLKIVAKYDEEKDVHIIVGVHIIGEGANELIQLGSCLVHSDATLEAISNTPTRIYVKPI